MGNAIARIFDSYLLIASWISMLFVYFFAMCFAKFLMVILPNGFLPGNRLKGSSNSWLVFLAICTFFLLSYATVAGDNIGSYWPPGLALAGGSVVGIFSGIRERAQYDLSQGMPDGDGEPEKV